MIAWHLLCIDCNAQTAATSRRQRNEWRERHEADNPGHRVYSRESRSTAG